MTIYSSTITRNRCLGLALLSLLIGFVIGGALDASVRPNEINLEVDPDSADVNVVPAIGDIIRWIPNRTSPKRNPKITFVTGSPCKETDDGSSLCTVVNAADVYRYKCDEPTCEDPGVDPRSIGGGLTLKVLNRHSVFAPFDDVSIFLGRLFTRKTHAPFQKNTSPVPNTHATPIAISCKSPTLQIYNPGGKPTQQVAKGQKIYWTATPLHFTVTLPGNTCDEQIINTEHHTCTISKSLTGDVSYTVKLTDQDASSSGCSGAAPGTLTPATTAQAELKLSNK